MDWPKFLVVVKEAIKNGGMVELEMYRNYWLRFPLFFKEQITIEQQSMFNLRQRKVVNKYLNNVDLHIWWKEHVRPEITRARFKRNDSESND